MDSAGMTMQFRCSDKTGALLVLRRPAERKAMLNTLLIRQYMREHIASWSQFANNRLGLGLEADKIIFVSGFVKASEWALAAFQSSREGCELTLDGSPLAQADSAQWHASMNGPNTAVYVRVGPRERINSDTYDAPRDQCVFINYFKMKRRSEFAPVEYMRAAAGPRDLPPSPKDRGSGPILVFEHDNINGENDEKVCLKSAHLQRLGLYAAH